MFNEHGNCVCTCVCMDERTSVCVCGISKLHLKTARWKEKDQIMTMRRGNWKISTKRYKRDSFFQPTLAGGNFPERGGVGLPFCSIQWCCNCTRSVFFPLIHWRHFFLFWNYKNKTENRTNNKNNTKKKRKSGAIGKPEKQASRALRLPASSYDDIPKPAAALGFRSPASSPSSSSSSPSSSRSWSCCGYYYALFTEWATFRFSLAFF